MSHYTYDSIDQDAKCNGVIHGGEKTQYAHANTPQGNLHFVYCYPRIKASSTSPPSLPHMNVTVSISNLKSSPAETETETLPYCVEVASTAVNQPTKHEYVVAYHKWNKVKVRAFNDLARAYEAYEYVHCYFSKILIQKPEGKVISFYGTDDFIRMCKATVDEIDSFLPTGSGLDSARNLEVKYNTEQPKFSGRAKCRSINGNWVMNHFKFRQGEAVQNIDGRVFPASHQF